MKCTSHSKITHIYSKSYLSELNLLCICCVCLDIFLCQKSHFTDNKTTIMKKLHIATILISLVLFLNKNVQGEEEELIPSTMCPRFSVQEFYLSLFKPMLDQRLDFIENLLQIGCEGVAEMLKKVEEKKGKDGSISKAGNFR